MFIHDLISVVVPVYNVESYLDRCVKSIIDQTYSNLEILLVDDGSTDNSSVLCDAWALKESRIKVIHKTNGGLSDARNVGMTNSMGEYIAFIDSDDWIAPEMLERLIKSIQENKSDISACAVEMVWGDGTPSKLLTVRTNCVLSCIEAQKALLEESLLKQPVWYKLYKRSCICNILFEVGKYHEDVFWSFQAIGNANSVSLIDYIGYYYYQRPNSIMGAGYSLKRLDVIEAYTKRVQYFDKYFPQLSSQSRIAVWNKCIYHGQMSLKYLPSELCDQAFAELKDTVSATTLFHRDMLNLKFSHRVWILLARRSLKMSCKIKNIMGVGL